MLRFAPSPTRDMHIGDLRVALLNYIVSQQKKEDFIVRIEDIDQEKNIEGKDQEILDLLDLFGIQYSQVIYQSKNFRFHSAMALQLLHETKAFNCFCSDDWIEKKRQEAKSENKPYKYDDACAHLPAELVIDNTNPFRVRISKSQKEIIIHDLLKGNIHFYTQDMESFVILHQDKTPTHNFASAVDDMLSDVSMIIRDEELINDTPKQEHIRASLQYDKKIKYAHIPTISNNHNFTLKTLLEEGYLPSAIVNYLISLGNQSPSEVFSLAEAIEWFDITNMSQSPTLFDIELLKNINREHLKRLDAKELSRYVGFADSEIGELAKLFLHTISTTKELKEKINTIFSNKTIPAEFKEQYQSLLGIIKQAPYFENYNEFQDYIMKESDVDSRNLSKLLHFLLVDSEEEIDITLAYKYLKNYIGEIIK